MTDETLEQENITEVEHEKQVLSAIAAVKEAAEQALPTPPTHFEETLTSEQLAALQYAKQLKGRLLKGWEQVQEAADRKQTKEYYRLLGLFNRLEDEYLKAKQVYAKTPADLLRCPTCSFLGQDFLYEEGKYQTACDIPCQYQPEKIE